MRIREVLTLKGIQQKELAAHIGVSSGTISQYVTGKRAPDYATLIKIADYLGVSIDYLLGRSENPDATKPPDDSQGSGISIEESIAKIDDKMSAIEELLGERPQQKNPAAHSDGMDEETRRFMKKFSQLSPPARQVLLAQADVFAQQEARLRELQGISDGSRKDDDK